MMVLTIEDLLGFVLMVIFVPFYHGKSPLKHHLRNLFNLFQPPNKQIQAYSFIVSFDEMIQLH